MTPDKPVGFIQGKKYQMFVTGTSQDTGGSNITVESASGVPYKVEVTGDLKSKIHTLKGYHATLVCTAVTEQGPEFVLDAEYFAPIPKKRTHGANIGVKTAATVELQKSLVYSVVTNQPDSDQPFEIAKQIAAFMNTEGGDLYLGVDANGFVTGVEGDFEILDQVPLLMNEKTDKQLSYTADIDGYINKLANAVILYLGQSAANFISHPDKLHDPEAGLTYVKIHVDPSDEIVYLGRDESVVFRSGAHVEFLRGRQRDLYVKERFYLRGEKSAAKSLEEFKKSYEELSHTLEETRSRLAEALAVKGGQTVADSREPPVSLASKIVIEDNMSVPLELDYVKAIGKIGGLVKDGVLVAKAGNWPDLFIELLRELVVVDPDKFESLPDEPSFRGRGKRVVFARKGTRTHLRDASYYLGPKCDIRADRRDGTRTAFYPDGLAVRLIRHFGLDPKQIRIWTGK